MGCFRRKQNFERDFQSPLSFEILCPAVSWEEAGKRKGLGKKGGDCWSQVTRIRNLDGRLNVDDELLIPLGHFDARNPRGGLALDAPH